MPLYNKLASNQCHHIHSHSIPFDSHSFTELFSLLKLQCFWLSTYSKSLKIDVKKYSLSNSCSSFINTLLHWCNLWISSQCKYIFVHFTMHFMICCWKIISQLWSGFVSSRAIPFTPGKRAIIFCGLVLTIWLDILFCQTVLFLLAKIIFFDSEFSSTLFTSFTFAVLSTVYLFIWFIFTFLIKLFFRRFNFIRNISQPCHFFFVIRKFTFARHY